MNLGALVKTAMGAVPDDAKASVTFTLKLPGVHSPQTGTFTTPVTSSVSGVASQDKANPKKYADLRITELDVQTLVFVPTTAGQEPAMNSEVLWNGLLYTVKNVEAIAPRGLSIASLVIIAR